MDIASASGGRPVRDVAPGTRDRSPKIKEKIMKKIIFLFYLTLSFCLNLSAQTKDLKFEMKYQIYSNDYLIVTDTINHKVGKAAGTGSVLFDDGSTALVKVFFIYDYINGNGDFIEYYCLTFPDSSTLTLQAKGKSFGSSDESMPLFTAQVNVTGCSGIYAGYKGSGNFTGNRRNVLENGSIVKLSFDISLIK